MTNINNQSLRMVRQIRSNFFSRCTNSYIRKKVTSRCPLDASAGRSMVEMLGVLAIIGVLSVGAIAGYSKAMSKYKLNKHMESFNILLNEAIKLLLASDEPTGDKSERYSSLTAAQLVSFTLKRTLRSKTEPRRGEIPLYIKQKNTQSLRLSIFIIGGAEGNRTPDLLNAIEALSQLSYNPISDGMRAYYNKNF